MDVREQFESALTAYEAARERAAAAVVVEQHALHSVIRIGADLGLSVRETSAALRVPKSTVARHRVTVPDQWGSAWLQPGTYVEAHNAAWAHEPERQIERAPFEVEDHEDGSRHFRLV